MLFCLDLLILSHVISGKMKSKRKT